MPKEEFYIGSQVAGDGQKPDIVVSWGTTEYPQVLINGMRSDRAGINRLIATLRKARNQVFGPDE